MLKLVGFFVLLALLATGAVWLADHPGRVEIDWLRWRLATSVPVLIGAVLLLAGGSYAAINLTHALLRWPGRWVGARRHRRREQGFQALSDGLAAVAGGQARQARRLAERAGKLLKDPKLTGLLVAQVAQLSGERDQQKQHFETLCQRPETALLGWRGLLALAEAAGDQAEAIRCIEAARRLVPADAALARQLFALLLGQGRLADAQQLIIDAVRRKAFGRAEASRKRALLLNDRARRAESEGAVADALGFARQAVANDPALADAALRLARLQAGQALGRQATATLEKAWRAKPLPELAAAYADLVPAEPPLARLRRLERLENLHPDAWITHRVMGEAALGARLWGQARKHLTAAMVRPTASLLGLLAQLEIGEYRNHKAAQTWLATTPAPDPSWICGECSGSSADWQVFCPHCGALDRLDWNGAVAIAKA
jgi:HemY protein